MDRQRTVRLSERLQMLAGMVTPGSRVADVGCDHGFLSIYLVQQGISPRAIAMDVRQGPLSRAREHVAKCGLEAYIETRLSDGLDEIRVGEADAMICAGMGGRLMARILKQGEDVAGAFKELILQPQSELEEFRAFLRREDYQILQEEILCEEGKYYFFLRVVKAQEAGGASPNSCVPQDLADKYGGLLLQEKHPVLKEYLEFMRAAYERSAKQIKGQTDSGGRAGRRLAELETELTDIEKAMKFYT